MYFTENQLQQYARPLSETEKIMCKNAIKMVKEALETLGFESEGDISILNEDTFAYRLKMRNKTASYKINIFVKGSYANNTNVRQNSDVDIAVVREDVFYDEYRTGITRENYNFVPANEHPGSFKDDVEEALKSKFGADEVKRGNKAIRVNGNTYRKDADCVPCFRVRDYRNDYSFNAENYIGGIKIFSDKGEVIVNYPEQHIQNGVTKNKATNFAYKKMIRIIKEMRYQLIEQENTNAKKTSSFGVEGLLWNVPDSIFTKYTNYGFTFEEIIAWLNNNIHSLNDFKEPNNILQLCNTNDKYQIYRQFITDLTEYFNYNYGS